MKRFTYAEIRVNIITDKIIYDGTKLLEKDKPMVNESLNILGAKGWELITIKTAGDNDSYIFKMEWND